MERYRESRLMVELEERRARHAKKFEGLSIEECLRIYKKEAEEAHKAMGFDLPKREKART
jgi:hypothetical protein